MTSPLMSAPLFPLNALVCPGGRLPLRIFEQRYLDMVSECMRHDSGFVVLMLIPQTQRPEGGDQHPFYHTGTMVKVVDFGQGEHALKITVEGQERVRVVAAERQEDGLWIGQLEPADEEAYVAIPERYEDLANVLKALVQHPMVEALNLAIDFADCRQVGWRLTELLPLENSQKQHLLEMTDPVYRLQRISDQLLQMMQ